MAARPRWHANVCNQGQEVKEETMQFREIMVQAVEVVHPDTSLLVAARKVRAPNITAVQDRA
jgi:CBS domain-containing protein